MAQALVGNFRPKPTVLPMHFSKLQKPKTMIVCATPVRPPSGGGSRRQINRTIKLSTKTTIGVGVLKEVTPNANTQLDVGEDNQKSSKKNYEDAAASSSSVQGAEQTD